MGSEICANEGCGATTSPEWKRGWGLKSGGFATLCYNCGSAYEKLVFCEKFHPDESGWRECKHCAKRIHCGCIASKYLYHYLDFGGIGCLRCVKDLEIRLLRPNQNPSDNKPNGLGILTTIGNSIASFVESRINGDCVKKRKLVQLGRTMEGNHPDHFLQSHKGDSNPSRGQIKREENMLPTQEVGTDFPHLTQQSGRPSIISKPDSGIPALERKDMCESLTQPSLSFSIGPPICDPNSVLPFPVEGIEKNKVPPFQQGQRTRHILPKPPKSGLNIGSVAKKEMASETRVARPPAEGLGHTQLLPRYWPKITDQELQQLSGDLNSTIVPLFEKVLSASDAGRIGRLVLPKACAEAYFPSISQSEGLPITVQDIKGKEWTFQFRFWTNNNSRMYVLEGISPCLQNMDLQAGDTVTFSRIDPGGKLVMGFRKETNSVDVQDVQTFALPNGNLSGETSFSGVNGNLVTDTFHCRENEERGGMTNKNSLHRPMLIPEKKNRNLGSKSKRLLIHSEDAMELRITWEEAQELLRPPPSAKPTVVMVENHEFEEYDEPPIFGKRTIFTAGASGEQEQWAQCDCCSKWRRLPVDILLPPKWTCAENIWDSNRCSCSAPEEMDTKKLGSCFRASKDLKKRRRIREIKIAQECEPSGLEALANAAVLEDLGEPSVGPTTRHPRHRPGCSCIVCIQPPSGKGKHKAMCVCNACMTVKRRFRTLMMRRKKRQSEREAGTALGKDLDGALGPTLQPMNRPENERGQGGPEMEEAEASTARLDLNLNFLPNRE